MTPELDAFKMHDEQGFPLTASVAAAQQHGTRINLAAFACDALDAGWTQDKVRRTLEEACADNGLPFVWADFYDKLVTLCRVSGAPSAPNHWKAMKAFIVDTPNRLTPA